MGQWIISGMYTNFSYSHVLNLSFLEMKKTHKRLGLVSSRHPAQLYESSSSMTLSHACMSVIGDLPMVRRAGQLYVSENLKI